MTRKFRRCRAFALGHPPLDLWDSSVCLAQESGMIIFTITTTTTLVRIRRSCRMRFGTD